MKLRNDEVLQALRRKTGMEGLAPATKGEFAQAIACAARTDISVDVQSRVSQVRIDIATRISHRGWTDAMRP